MSPRERTIAIALLAGVTLAAGAFLFHLLYLVPLRDREDSIRTAQAARDSLQVRFEKVTSQKDILDKWRKLSLPSDDGFCRLEYNKLLGTMMKTSGFADIVVRASDGPDIRRGLVLDTKTFYTPLSFTVSGHGNLSHVVKLLQEFYQTPLLHKIKSLSIRRPTTPNMGDLEIELSVEAIIVSGAENRSKLLPAETAHNLARPPGDYAAIAAKDIFYGPPPQQQKPDEGLDPALAVILRMITYDDEEGFQANLYNDTDKTSCWLCPGSGFVRFEIRSKRKLWHEGEVISIDLPGGKVVFRAEDKHYAIHLDQTLGEALRKPLSEVQVRELILTRAPGSNGAQ